MRMSSPRTISTPCSPDRPVANAAGAVRRPACVWTGPTGRSIQGNFPSSASVSLCRDARVRQGSDTQARRSPRGVHAPRWPAAALAVPSLVPDCTAPRNLPPRRPSDHAPCGAEARCRAVPARCGSPRCLAATVSAAQACDGSRAQPKATGGECRAARATGPGDTDRIQKGFGLRERRSVAATAAPTPLFAGTAAAGRTAATARRDIRGRWMAAGSRSKRCPARRPWDVARRHVR